MQDCLVCLLFIVPVRGVRPSSVVTPTKEDSRFAISHGVVSASSDEIASAKDLV